MRRSSRRSDGGEEGSIAVEVFVLGVLLLVPLLPPAVALHAPGTVPVSASAVQRVSMFRAVP